MHIGRRPYCDRLPDEAVSRIRYPTATALRDEALRGAHLRIGRRAGAAAGQACRSAARWRHAVEVSVRTAQAQRRL